MKIKSRTLAIIIIIVVCGGIFTGSALGYWKTTNTKTPEKFNTGEFAGQANPADIRGSYSFADISNTFGVPIEDLGIAFGLTDPQKYADFKCKDLESIYSSLAAAGTDVGTGSVRYFVALYKGLPITLTEESYLPESAVEILKTKATLTPDQIKYLDTHTVTMETLMKAVPSATAAETTATTPAATATAPISETHEAVASPAKNPALQEIKGKTTFKELLEWGLKKEDIEQVIGDTLPNTSITVRDYATQKGVEFNTYKIPLQELLNNR